MALNLFLPMLHSRHVVAAGSAEPTDPPKILIILHQETSSAGRVGQELVRRGYRLDVRKPRFGDPLPETMAGHAGAVIFGGPMSANDPDPFIKEEIDWLDVPLREEKPYLGICLGAQMLARHLGARVAPHDDGHVEIGYYGLTPTELGTSLMDWPEKVYHWHREGFDLPAGADLLATGDTFPNQAIRVGPAAYGIQFHPELTYAMMNRWCVRGSERLCGQGAQPRGLHFHGRQVHDAAVKAWLDAFLDRWLGERAAT